MTCSNDFQMAIFKGVQKSVVSQARFGPKFKFFVLLTFFVELRVELGPGCQAQSRFSKTVLFNGVYYCKSVKMMESKLIYQRMNIGSKRL